MRHLLLAINWGVWWEAHCWWEAWGPGPPGPPLNPALTAVRSYFHCSSGLSLQPWFSWPTAAADREIIYDISRCRDYTHYSSVSWRTLRSRDRRSHPSSTDWRSVWSDAVIYTRTSTAEQCCQVDVISKRLQPTNSLTERWTIGYAKYGNAVEYDD